MSAGFSLARAPPPVLRRAPSVVARDKDGGYGKLIVRQISRAVLGVVNATVHNEAHASLVQDVCDELKRKARESVTVHHHNLFERAVVGMVKQCQQPSAVKVDARRNVRDHSVLRICGSEICNLPLQSSLLMSRRNTNVYHSLFCLRRGRDSKQVLQM